MSEGLMRRLFQMVGLFKIAATADDQPTHIVQLDMGDNQVRDNTRVILSYGFFSHAPAGTDAVALSVSGDRSNMLVIGTNNQAARPRNTKMGEVWIHDDQGTSIVLGRNGITINGGGRPITVTNASKARFEMPIESTGEVTAMVDSAARHLSTHVHPDAQGGFTGQAQG